MDSVTLCAAKLGYTVIEREIAATAVADVYAELEVITRLCAKDKTTLSVFSDKDDIAKIQEWREGFGNESRECPTIFVWDSLIYYISKSDKNKTLKEWELLLSKQPSLECVVCFERITASADARPCLACHAMCCADCNWKQSLPECPVCKAFDMKSYVRNPGVYAAQLLPQLGIAMSDVKTSKDMCARQIKELTGFHHLDDLIDSAMVTAWEKVYDVRDQL
ncbi:unnamed protein product, partial [Ectocarpus sp. 13 AM-2016]